MAFRTSFPPISHEFGVELLNDIFDLVTRRLPQLATDDPVRLEWAAALPELAQCLGRPTVEIVREPA